MVILVDIIKYILDNKSVIRPITICSIGSFTLPYLTFYRDKDILIYTDPDNVVSCRHFIRDQRKQGLLLDDIHVTTVANNKGRDTYPYLFHYAQLLWGDPVPSVDIFNDMILQRTCIIRWLQFLISSNSRKNIYHIYTLMCFWDHNDYLLTPEEVKIVNLLHSFDQTTNEQLLAEWCLKLLTRLWDRACKMNITLDQIPSEDNKLILSSILQN